MRHCVHDTGVYFRANQSIVEAAQHLARREGMSLSELLRTALRRELNNSGVARQ